MTSRRIRLTAILCLAGGLLLLLKSQRGPVSDESAPGGIRTEIRSESHIADSLVLQASGIQPEAPTPPPPAPPETGTPTPDYASIDFIHVPDWMPRPANAVSASAVDASLRSDGFVEGMLHFEFREDQTGAIEQITSHLMAAGMMAAADGSTYVSEDPPRRCELRVEHAAGGAMRVNLSYQGIDHEKGCHCPTCGGPLEHPEP